MKLGLLNNARTFRRRAIHWLQSPDSDPLPTLALPCLANFQKPLAYKAKTIRSHAGIKIRKAPEEGEIDHIRARISGLGNEVDGQAGKVSGTVSL